MVDYLSTCPCLLGVPLLPPLLSALEVLAFLDTVSGDDPRSLLKLFAPDLMPVAFDVEATLFNMLITEGLSINC